MSDAEVILAIDQGTTGTTCLLVDRSGRVRSRGYARLKSRYPQDVWVEQDARDIWNSVLESASEALGSDKPRLAAIGITNQRETTVLWDADTGEPLAPAIVWQDRRTVGLCERLIEDGYGQSIADATGLVIDPYSSGTKVRWLLESDPGLAEAARSGRAKFGTVDSWLIWKLTGGDVHIVDASNASRTMLCDIDRVAWSDDLLEILNVPKSMLPTIVPSSGDLAITSGDGVIPAGVRIGGMAGDQQAALFGQVCFDPGMLKVTYGTGCFLLANVGEKRMRSKSRLLSTIAWRIGEKTVYAIEGSVFMGGAVIQWLRDALRLIDSSEESEIVASEVNDTAGVTLVPAFVGLGAPHWNARARGILTGLTQGATRAHIVRAALESIAHQVADVAETMALESIPLADEVRVDGGASRNDLLMQIQSDLLDARVIRPAMIETTALGAAYLAGLAVGFWKSEDDLRSIWRMDREFSPSKDPTVVKRRREWGRAVARSLDWAEA